MPKRKQKSREERYAEDFFPVKPEDIKYAIEKPVSESQRAMLADKISTKKQTRKRKSNTYKKKFSKPKKSSRKKSKKIEFKPKKIKLKKQGYELIITEKPQAASKISSALSNNKANKKASNSVAYYEFEKNNKQIIVACAVGHLFTLTQETNKKEAIFDIKWVPNYLVKKRDFSKKYYNTLLKLVKNAGSLTVATDYDVEGELIGSNIIKFIAGQEDASRMKFSTLTSKELEKSYKEKSSTLNWGQAIAGETRHFLDWYYGINLSRALMNAIKTTGRFKLMSIGRVQGPTLKLIVEKEKKIKSFKPKPYWHVYALIQDSKGNKAELLHNKDIFDKNKLEDFKKLKTKKTKVKTENKTAKIPPKAPFNLTALQTEAYKLYKITPSKTLQLAQNLYLNGLISYPRTSSQKLPPSINYKEILKKIAKKYKSENLLKRKTPIQGKKSDPAHPSIYPTGEAMGTALNQDERKIYDLICKRFLALFMEDAVKETKKLSIEIEKLKFSKKSSFLKEKNWIEIYPVKISEEKLPDMEKEVEIKEIKFEGKETQPPKRYSPASIVSVLEKKNLGTKATRSSILDTLYNRDYIKNTSIEATPLGISLIESLEKYSPIITNESLTRKFEKEMETIRKAKKNLEKRKNKILDEAKNTIKKIYSEFKKHEEKIGKELLQATIKFRRQQQEENKLNICPKCKKGYLVIKYSRKTKRYFVACDKYPDCKNTYTLPPHGLMKPAKSGDKKTICEECGFPMIMALQKGKRPWIFCFNPNCETNKKRIEEYYKRKEKKRKKN